ncbi:hypothetical protein FIBSPDRAFT_846499 [Athelia psychrophila]|uniref:Uncharacterized protein n=1 Tax=Athelia psychrophila TaxID=1759441 RepID=A0A166X3B3_9AGAM|nr:hypothetical protein FIBSPDRAFT_846499 [Fibularhizoctonia sp. CBS 109695]
MGVPCLKLSEGNCHYSRRRAKWLFAWGGELLYCCSKSQNFMIKVGNVSDESRGHCFLDC